MTFVIKQDLPAIRVVGETIASYHTCQPLWEKAQAVVQSHQLQVTGPCLSIFYDPGYKPADVDIEVCFPIDANVTNPSIANENNGTVTRIADLDPLPKAATLVHEGPFRHLKASYDRLFAWIAAQQHQVMGPVREVYVVMDPNDQTQASYRTELQVPIA